MPYCKLCYQEEELCAICGICEACHPDHLYEAPEPRTLADEMEDWGDRAYHEKQEEPCSSS